MMHFLEWNCWVPICVYILLVLSKSFPNDYTTSSQLPEVYESSRCSTSLETHSMGNPLNFSHSCKCVVLSYTALKFSFLRSLMKLRTYSCLLAIWISSLLTWPFIFFIIFPFFLLDQLTFPSFLLLEFLYILSMRFLSTKCGYLGMLIYNFALLKFVINDTFMFNIMTVRHFNVIYLHPDSYAIAVLYCHSIYS